MKILKTGANVFLTGEPGSGKTYAINLYVAWLKKHGIQPAITASTGIAATHIGGMTIHSFSGIGVAESLSEGEVGRIASIEKIADRISATDVLIIDEVSMLSANTLQMVERVFREVQRNEMPFGGVQVIFVGDFFQLAPVAVEGRIAPYAFESQAWQFVNPVVCYLTDQYRQEDGVFLDILGAIRNNSIGQTHRQVVLSRLIDFAKSPREAPKLFAHNADVDRINSAELHKLPGGPGIFHMHSKGSKVLVQQLKRGCLSPQELELKKNAVVMFTKNSPQARFVNGTLGIVQGFEQDSGLPIVKIKSGHKIIVAPMKWTIEERGSIKAAIEQIPLRLAWAITVHKSQGMSLDEAVMDLSKAFEYGQGYVALSRIRKLSGLHLLGINDKALMVNPKILNKDQEFRQGSVHSQEKLDSLIHELEKLHNQFIKACGGQIEEIQANPNGVKQWPGTKSKRWEDTLELIKQRKTIAEVAKLRSRSEGTIYQHLEELQKLGKLSSEDLKHLRLGNEKIIDEICSVFQVLGTERLKPIFDHFSGQYSYQDIRLARLMGPNSRE